MLCRPRSGARLLHSRRPWRRQPGLGGRQQLGEPAPRRAPPPPSRLFTAHALQRYKRPRPLPSQAFSRAPGPAAPDDTPYPSSSTCLQALYGSRFSATVAAAAADDALRRGREKRRGRGCSASPARIPHPSGGGLRPCTALPLRLLQPHLLHPRPAESQQTAGTRPLPFSLPPRSCSSKSPRSPAGLTRLVKISLRKAAESLELRLSAPHVKISKRHPGK